MQERENRERRWLRLHAITAPMGVAAVTALLAWPGGSDNETQSAAAAFLNSAAEKAYLATVTYALMAAIVEGVVRMVFWAWSEHKKTIQRHKDEGRAEGRAEAAKEYEPIVVALSMEREARQDAPKESEAQLIADAVGKALDARLDAAVARERDAQLIAATVARELDARLAAAAKEREESLAAARERARADGIDLDKYLNP